MFRKYSKIKMFATTLTNQNVIREHVEADKYGGILTTTQFRICCLLVCYTKT
jgi:hypothetical protein